MPKLKRKQTQRHEAQGRAGPSLPKMQAAVAAAPPRNDRAKVPSRTAFIDVIFCKNTFVFIER
jgi:hypothetical protein